MMRLLIPLFSPATGTWGGITRAVALYEAACRLGHEVAFCSSGAIVEGLKKHGCIVYPTPPTTLFGLPASISRALEQRSQRITLPVKPGKSVGSLWMVMALSGLARTGYLRDLVKAQRAAVRDFRADAIFTDIDPGAYLTAAIERLPVAGNYSKIMQHGVGGFAWKQMNGAIAPLFKENSLAARPIDALYTAPEVLKVIPSIPEMDGAPANRPDILYVGQLLGPVQPPKLSEFQPEPGKRYIFVYMGTGSLSLDQLRAILPQVFPAGGDTICLVGSQSAQEEQLGNVHFRRYVPANAVLPFCDWVFCHGGQNTIAQSLMNSVPLIVFPGPVFERRFNAQKVQENGAGFMGEINQFTAQWILEKLAARAGCKARAAQLGERIRSYGGAEAVIEAISARVKKKYAREIG